MNYQLIARPEGEVAEYAAAELLRCLSAMDGSLAEGRGGLELSLAVLDGDPEEDRIEIRVKDGRGTIAGSSEGAVLIAVYRFLYELGCRWTHPGEGGEHLPSRTLTPAEVNVTVAETPSRRHRGVCIEGAVSEENVREMIEFLPRVGMNSYFIQFFRPTVFFQRWYGHWQNPYLPTAEKTAEEIDAIHARLINEIRRRGLRHHAVGHGWTCVPFGIEGEGWHMLNDVTFSQEYIDITALRDGKRGVYCNVPLNTNLCYSDPAVRARIVDAVVNYCRENSSVSVLHLWLADGKNNFCECAECSKLRPSDYYVRMLNELDGALTAAGLDTKIVFLIYVDLLWAPERETIRNPDRFLMMFAPISRTYSETLREGSAAGRDTPVAPYVRNKLEFPKAVGENVKYLDEWRKTFPGSGFLFDYHLMWDHAKDPGYMQCARTLFEDMKDLDVLGLDGMISCQLSRSAFPTCLPLYGMAKALWNKEADFDDVAMEYFTAEFGDAAADVFAYLTELSRRFDPVWLRGELPAVDKERAAVLDTIPTLVAKFRAAHPELSRSSESEPWRTLAVHADYAVLVAAVAARRARGEDRRDLGDALRAFVGRNEELIQCRIDVWNTLANFVEGSLMK